MDRATRERLTARLKDYKDKRDKLSASLDSGLENSEIQTYSLTDPEGGQSVTRRDPKTILDMIERLDRQIDYLERRIADRTAVFVQRRW